MMHYKYEDIEREFIDTLEYFDFDVKHLYETYFNKLKEIKERDDYHPEPSVYHHILKVFNRACDIYPRSTVLVIAAIFHDIGKLITYTTYGNSFGHENESLKIFIDEGSKASLTKDTYANIQYIISNHMRIHQYNNMKKSKQDSLNKHPYFEKLQLFETMDNMNNTDFNDLNIQ